jgi:predicted transcriptional regulator YheO
MNIKPIKLTKADKLILQSCKNSIDGLSDYLGKGFELVLHSLENFDQSVIKIVMGYHSGRHEGSPLTNLALDMLATINQDQNSKKYISYFNKRENGEILKSTTIAIMGERERIIGLLCINLYLTTSIADMFSDYAPR